MKRNLQIILALGLITTAGHVIAGGVTNSVVNGKIVGVRVIDGRPAEGLSNFIKNSSLAPVPGTNAMRGPEAPGKPAPEQPPAEVPPTKPDEKGDFKAFQLVIDRNIFDMSRTGARPTHQQPTRRVKVDDFTLYGTSSYEKGQYAFFEGSSSDYRQICKLGGSIAGFKVAQIGSDYVELQGTNGGKMVKMDVGTTMRREDNGPWSAPSVRSDASLADSGGGSRERGDRGGRSERRSRGDRGSSTDSGATSSSDQNSGSSSSGGSQDDIIKRLMEKRAKEVKDDQ